MPDSDDKYVIKLLEDIRSNLEKLIELQSNTRTDTTFTNPWPVNLISEIQTGEDHDDNGLVFGHDFSLDENPSSAPPMLQGLMIQMEKAQKHLPKQLTWEEYVSTLPAGPFKTKVSSYVEKAGTRKNLMEKINLGDN